jgi:hypothetical protein
VLSADHISGSYQYRINLGTIREQVGSRRAAWESSSFSLQLAPFFLSLSSVIHPKQTSNRSKTTHVASKCRTASYTYQTTPTIASRSHRNPPPTPIQTSTPDPVSLVEGAKSNATRNNHVPIASKHTSTAYSPLPAGLPGNRGSNRTQN